MRSLLIRPAFVLLVVACLSFAPFLDYPEWRGTEARRVQIATEMVESGDFLVPRLWGEPTFAKPPFYYWLLAVPISLVGPAPWAVRLLSLLGFYILALAAYHCLRRWNTERGEVIGWIGSIGVLLSPVLMYDAPFAEIDPMFSVLTVLSILALCDGVLEGRRGRVILAGVLGGLAVMTKGPPYLMFCVGPFMLWWKRSRCAGMHWYLLPVIGFYLIYKLVLDHYGPGQAVAGIAVKESLGRLEFWTAESLEDIPQHLLMAAVVIPLPFTIWFWSWWKTSRKQTDAAARRQNFLVWAGVGGLIMLLFSSGRSTRYLMPAIPLLIIGIAPLVAASLCSASVPSLALRRILAVLGMAMAIGFVGLAFARFPYPGSTVLALGALASIAFFLDSDRRLVGYCLVLPLIFSWSAFPDRVRYHCSASDFAPDPAAVLARELRARGIEQVGVYVGVSTPMLLHTVELVEGLAMRRDGDPARGIAPTSEWLIASDRGYVKYPERRHVDLCEIAGYREVLRVQMGPKKSISLRQRL